jgi:threonylcarbamoyladenosine tRNA methylthiotransferase MtaB
LHVCLQSGSDAVLRRMRRRWSAKMFVDRCQLVKETLDRPAFTTDAIIGFPGETDEDFAATERVVREVGFRTASLFLQPRRGTPAATMEKQVPKRSERYALLKPSKANCAQPIEFRSSTSDWPSC